MSGSIRTPFRFVMDFVPSDGVVRARGGGHPDGERQPSLPRNDEQLKDFTTFRIVG